MKKRKMTESEIASAIARDKEWMENLDPDESFVISKDVLKAIFGKDGAEKTDESEDVDDEFSGEETSDEDTAAVDLDEASGLDDDDEDDDDEEDEDDDDEADVVVFEDDDDEDGDDTDDEADAEDDDDDEGLNIPKGLVAGVVCGALLGGFLGAVFSDD